MWDQSVSPPCGGCVYSDANALFFYPGVGDPRRAYDSASAGTSSPQQGREIKIRGSAISLAAAARSRRGLVLHTATMSDREGKRMRIKIQEPEFRIMSYRMDRRPIWASPAVSEPAW